MSRIAKPLTDTEIKKSKYTSKEEFEILKKVNPNIQRKNKLSDGNGLFLIIRETGTKMWQFDFKFLDKRYSMSFGIYPDVSLKDARDIREKALQNIKKGINPIESKKSNFQIDNTFKHIAEKWLLNMKDGWSESNFKKIKSNFENNAFPFIGSKDIKQITRRDILKLIEEFPNIKAIFCNGGKSFKNLQKIVGKNVEVPIYLLPSTSPLHTISFERKLMDWSIIKIHL